MGALFRLPHGFLRRHLSMVERALVAAGVSLALYQLMSTLPAYPSPWEVVMAVTIFFVVLWSPPVGYFVAVVTALYPLYTVSLYLAVLFLAIALLGQRVFMHNMGAALLVLLAPWLAQFHLEWLVVLLGGLWWGKSGGAWIGGAAALWGQVLFGMAGQYPNWLDMMGFAPAAQGLFSQFKDANSLETLKLIVFPLAPNPTQLLFHLLQIVLWAMTAGLIGGIVERSWAQQRHPWRAIGVAIIGAAVMALGSLGLATWLEQYGPEDFAWLVPGLAESGLYAAIGAAVLEGLRDFIEHPLPMIGLPKSPSRAQAAPKPRATLAQRLLARMRPRRETKPAPAVEAAQVSAAKAEGPAREGPYQPLPVPSNLPRRDAKKQRPDDIIKIELD